MHVLSAHPVARYLIIFILLVGVYFFHGFIVPILGALIIGFATWPRYYQLLYICRGRNWLAASIAIFIVVVIIVLPFLWLSHYLFDEFKNVISWLTEVNRYGKPTPKWMQNLPGIGNYLHQLWSEYLIHPYGVTDLTRKFGLGHLANLGTYALSFAKNISAIMLSLIFMLITLFFFYKDGRSFRRQIDKAGEMILPLRWQRISRVVPTMVSATVMGMTIIAIGEGIVLGFCYWLAGAPSPITLGILTGFFALIPGGAPLSMTLVSLYLVGSGHAMNGILLFIWGAVELFIVDKTIRPRLVGGPAKLPFLPTFFGLVGGVKTMGLIGLFIGPVVMALIVALWREWLIDEENTALLKVQQSRAMHAKSNHEFRNKKRLSIGYKPKSPINLFRRSNKEMK